MKKLIYDKFGGIEVLKMAEVPVPVVDPDSVLIKVAAVSINPLDWKIREGEMKLMSGSKFPKGMGIDFAGIVEETGASVKKFKKGEEIFGTLDPFNSGALAEYIVVTENDIAPKPSNISFQQAAALSITGSAAIQIFDKLVKCRPGAEILINGASGGIGMFAIQIAKSQGAIVTAVVGEKGMAAAQKWGSDKVIDYRQTDILAGNKKYDALIDLSGKIPFSQARAIMKPISDYVNAIPGPVQIIGSFLHNLLSKKKYKVLLLKATPAYLTTLAKYAADGMDILVSSSYSFDDYQEAYTIAPKGGILGKAVFTMK